MKPSLFVIFNTRVSHHLPLVGKAKNHRNHILRITKTLRMSAKSTDQCDLYVGTLTVCNSLPTPVLGDSPIQVFVKWNEGPEKPGSQSKLKNEIKFYAEHIAGTRLEGSIVPRFYGGYGTEYGPSCLVLEYCSGELARIKLEKGEATPPDAEWSTVSNEWESTSSGNEDYTI